MLKRERQAFIMHQLNLHNKVLSTDLCQQISVSEDTIRRDLHELADMGKIIKVHGGALSRSFHNSFQQSDIYHAAEKKMIAEKAVHLIHDGMMVLTSGGSTIIELARSIPVDLRATFITGSLPVAMEYMHHPSIEVILIGDKLSKNSQITVGAKAIATISEINADICFLGTNAIDIEHGITDNDWDVVALKKAMIKNSKQVITLSISEKLNTVQKLQVCELNKVQMLITELNADEEALYEYRKIGIDIL
jgi:DeoR/GlpR family transcriptional regulator of sugar metabolism